MTEFTCDLKSLLNLLNTVAPTIPKNPSHPILTHIICTVSDDKLSITGTSLDLWIAGEIDCTIYTPGSFLIPFKLFEDALKKDKEKVESYHFKYDEETKKLDMKANNTHFQLQGENVEEYPEMPIVKNNHLRLTREVCQLMLSAGKCVSKDDRKYLLTGIQFQVRQYTDKRTIVVAGTNGSNLYKAEIKFDDQPADIGDTEEGYRKEHGVTIAGKLINSALEKMLNNLPDDTEIDLFYDEHNIAITAQNFCLIGRTWEGDYPMFEKAIPKVLNGFEVIVPRKEVIKISERLGIFTKLQRDGQSFNILLSVEDQQLAMSADAGVYGSGDESIPATISKLHESDENKYPLERKWGLPEFEQGLKILKDTDILIKLGTKLQPIVFEPYINKYNELYVTMPSQK